MLFLSFREFLLHCIPVDSVKGSELKSEAGKSCKERYVAVHTVCMGIMNDTEDRCMLLLQLFLHLYPPQFRSA